MGNSSLGSAEHSSKDQLGSARQGKLRAFLSITAGEEGSQTWVLQDRVKKDGDLGLQGLFFSNGEKNVIFRMVGLWGSGR